MMTRDRIARPAPVPSLPRSDMGARTLPRVEAAPHRGWPWRILVGTDGTSASASAIRAAHALAERTGAEVEMETVYRPRVPMPSTNARRGIDQCERTDRAPAVTLLRKVQRQRRELPRDAHGWPLRLEIGDPAAVITGSAKETGSDLVVTGIGHFDPVGARCDGRTVLRMARHLDVALFAVAPGFETPTRCVIVLPDGRMHGPTIDAALQCLPADARVWIALPDRSVAPNPALVEYGSAREIALGARATNAPADERDRRTFTRVDIAGDMLAGVLRLAEEVGAELLAVPNRGEPGQVRVFLPNLAEPLLVAAPCSVLVVPDVTKKEAA